MSGLQQIYGKEEMSLIKNQTLKSKADLHLARKTWHFLGVTCIIVAYHNFARLDSLTYLAVATAFFVGNDILRQFIPSLNRLSIFVFSPIMRDSEKNGIAGTTHLLLGVSVVVALFPKDVVMISLMFLAAADPLASYFGVRFGKDKLIGSKSLQGSFAAFVVCTLISCIYFYSQGLMLERVFIVSLLAGFAGATAELAPVGPLDDNFTIPVFGAIMLWIIFYIFGGLS